jgi:AraC family transcriptional regulator, positive regulator of tynA and feaB
MKMSARSSPALDPASHRESRLLDITTDGVPEADRATFWRTRVARRNVFRQLDTHRPFHAQMRRLVLPEAELVEHASGAIVSMPAPGRPRMQGGEDVAIELVREGDGAVLDHDGERRLRTGDLYVVDYARPLQIARPRHRFSGIVLSRDRVMETMGRDLPALAGRQIPLRGLAAALRRRMVAALDGAPGLTAAAQEEQVRAVAEMALAIFGAMKAGDGAVDGERFDEGFYHAARSHIARHCVDPDLVPDDVARAIGCSRATLYRAFTKRGEGVSEAIWTARIAHARSHLLSTDAGLPVSIVAQRAGFRDMPTFTRMFRRHFGMAPSAARRN